MKRNWEQDYKESFSNLQFTKEEKLSMAKNIMQKLDQQPQKRNGHKLLVLALAAAIAVATLTGAGIYTRWSRSAGLEYKLSEHQKKDAMKSGLSVMLEETQEVKADTQTVNENKIEKTENTPVIRATDNGITITAVQTFVDKYRAHLVFRIDGFNLPAKEYPSIEGDVISINGKAPMRGMGAGFYNGITEQRDGTIVYDDGTPVKEDGFGGVRYSDANGALEYTIDLCFPTSNDTAWPNGLKPLEHLGSEIVVKFTSIGISDGLEHVPMVDGDWTLKWTLSGTEQTRFITPDAPIGDSGFILHSVELTPISCIMVLEGDSTKFINPYTKEYQEHWNPELKGVILKDGTFLRAPKKIGGETCLGNNLHRVEESILAVDPDDVASIVFYGRNWTNDRSDEFIASIS